MKAFNGNFVQLVRQMNAAKTGLNAMPADQSWTLDSYTVLGDARLAALQLATTIQKIRDAFQVSASKL